VRQLLTSFNPSGPHNIICKWGMEKCPNVVARPGCESDSTDQPTDRPTMPGRDQC
jgi:hypothetical protein